MTAKRDSPRRQCVSRARVTRTRNFEAIRKPIQFVWEISPISHTHAPAMRLLGKQNKISTLPHVPHVIHVNGRLRDESTTDFFSRDLRDRRAPRAYVNEPMPY